MNRAWLQVTRRLASRGVLGWVCLCMAASQSAAQSDDQEGLTPEQRQSAEGRLRRLDAPSETLDRSEAGYISWLLLDWAGARTSLSDAGLEIALISTTDGSVALEGGADPGEGLARTLVDLDVAYNTEPQLGLPGGLLSAGFQWITGVDASTRYGLIQPFSNIDSERRLQVSRLWYEQFISNSGTRIRLGKIDGNSLFAYPEAGATFLHSSMGFSPTIFLMPTYPDTAFGGTWSQEILDDVSVRAGVFDGSFASGVRTGQHGPSTLFDSKDELFYIGEAEFNWAPETLGRFVFGGWQHTATLERFDGGSEDGTSGTYAILEQRLWNQPSFGGATLDGFLQLGWADPEVSPFETHIGFGVVANNWVSGRPDHFGFGVSHVELSSDPGAGFSEPDETAFELFYGFEPLPWLRVKPDLQYVRNPGGDAALKDAWIATLRVTLSL